jgi:hypothetical protein
MYTKRKYKLVKLRFVSSVSIVNRLLDYKKVDYSVVHDDEISKNFSSHKIFYF